MYPPDTPKNSDFVLYLGETFSKKKPRIGYLYLERKNEDLFSFLKRLDVTLTDEQERVIEIHLIPAELEFADMAVVIDYIQEPTTTQCDVEAVMDRFLSSGN